jgi:hypothetical protein
VSLEARERRLRVAPPVRRVEGVGVRAGSARASDGRGAPGCRVGGRDWVERVVARGSRPARRPERRAAEHRAGPRSAAGERLECGPQGVRLLVAGDKRRQGRVGHVRHTEPGLVVRRERADGLSDSAEDGHVAGDRPVSRAMSACVRRGGSSSARYMRAVSMTWRRCAGPPRARAPPACRRALLRRKAMGGPAESGGESDADVACGAAGSIQGPRRSLVNARGVLSRGGTAGRRAAAARRRPAAARARHPSAGLNSPVDRM